MPRHKIASLQNPKIKQFNKLKNHSRRDGEGLVIVEGFKEITSAIDAGIEIHSLFMTDCFLKKETRALIFSLERQGIDIIELPKQLFEKISYGDREDGLIALCRIAGKRFDGLKLTANPLFLVVENLEKPGNLGAIVRTADSVGASAVIICDARTDIYNPNVIRASLGAVFAVQIVTASNEETLNFLKSKKTKICCATPEAKLLYTQVNWKEPSALIVGSEHEGVSDFWKKNATQSINIPLLGKTDSLNVSVSAAVILYEALRQRS